MKKGDKVKVTKGTWGKCEGVIIDTYPLEVEKDYFQDVIMVDLGKVVIPFREEELDIIG